MSKGKKIYFIITCAVVMLTCLVDILAIIGFIDALFLDTQLERGLSIVALFLYWLIIGGSMTVVSLIMCGFLFKVSVKYALILTISVVSMAVITFVIWYVCATNLPSDAARYFPIF